jgi:hypothetical protein
LAFEVMSISRDTATIKDSSTMATMVHRGWRLPNKASESNSNDPKVTKELSREGMEDSDTKKWKEEGDVGTGVGSFLVVPTTRPPKHRFEFINTTGDRRTKDSVLRKLVRSHATQDHTLRPKGRKGKKSRGHALLTASFIEASQEKARPEPGNLP